jgi:hypothetical protein
MAKIKKAQTGTGPLKKKTTDGLSKMNEPTPKGYVRGEMTGRLMPISERRKREKEMAESLNEVRFGTKNPAAKPSPVKKVPGKKMKSGGSLKPVDSSKNPGLAKLPTPVRNKMGYQKYGGKVNKKSK